MGQVNLEGKGDLGISLSGIGTTVSGPGKGDLSPALTSQVLPKKRGRYPLFSLFRFFSQKKREEKGTLPFVFTFPFLFAEEKRRKGDATLCFHFSVSFAADLVACSAIPCHCAFRFS